MSLLRGCWKAASRGLSVTSMTTPQQCVGVAAAVGGPNRRWISSTPPAAAAAAAPFDDYDYSTSTETSNCFRDEDIPTPPIGYPWAASGMSGMGVGSGVGMESSANPVPFGWSTAPAAEKDDHSHDELADDNLSADNDNHGFDYDNYAEPTSSSVSSSSSSSASDPSDPGSIPFAPRLVRQVVPEGARPHAIGVDMAKVVLHATPANTTAAGKLAAADKQSATEFMNTKSPEVAQRRKESMAEWRNQPKRQMDPVKAAQNRSERIDQSHDRYGKVRGPIPGPIVSHMSEVIANTPDIDARVRAVFVGDPRYTPKLNERSDSVWYAAGNRKMTHDELWARQIKDEANARDNAMLRSIQSIESLKGSSKAGTVGPGQRMLKEWYEDFMTAVNEEFKLIKEQHEQVKNKRPPRHLTKHQRQRWLDRREYGPLLLSVPASTLVITTITELLSHIMHSTRPDTSLSWVNTTVAIGQAIETECVLWRDRQNVEKWRRLVGRARTDSEAKGQSIPQFKRQTVLSMSSEPWSIQQRVQVGGALLELLMPVAKLNFSNEVVKCFTYQQIRRPAKAYKTEGILKIDLRTYDLLLKEDVLWEVIQPRYKPMVLPPRPWVKFNQGGYVTLTAPMVRTTPGGNSQKIAARVADMPQIYEALDLVGSTAWTINEKVLEVMKNLYHNEKGGKASLPPLENLKEGPIPLWDVKKVQMDPKTQKLSTQGKQQWVQHRRKVAEAVKILVDNRNRVSMRAELQYKLELADDLKGRPFYLPANMDFRGRTYPIPPHLSHTGSDIARGILTFHKARPLGELGLRWLKIHLANTFGKNKLSYDQRVEWADSNLHFIKESAKNPLGTKTDKTGRWWLMEAEDHWQALAACIEINAALNTVGGPHLYECHLPVQMDGSCNGLQHYAALGRDERGGKAVNLTPDIGLPADVYTDVLQAVRARVANDNSNSDPIAHLVHGKLTRKIVKQTVMTSVYGVTFIGARDQIAARLAETDIKWPDLGDKSADAVRKEAAGYLARVTLDSIGDVFTVGKQIMTWLKMVSMQLSLRGHPTAWITPLGLPVVQPYRRHRQVTVRTAAQSVTLTESHDLLPLDADRQKDALPPNFVHSLDATHMFMTARTCIKKEGLTFASVHDSFWTHAGDVTTLQRVLRDEFCNLYSAKPDPLEQFYDQLCMRFPEIKFPPPPKRGTLALDNVRRSAYFFS